LNENFRPRFRFYTDLSVETVHEKVIKRLEENNPKRFVYGKILQHHRVLKYPQSSRDFFTPQMDIAVEKEDGKTLVRCLIGPAPIIWTFFMFAYGILGTIALFSGFFWGSYAMLGKSSMLYLPALISLLLMLGLYIGVKVAKANTKPEMEKLKQFLDKSLGCDCFKEALKS
jgi:hypothetical protein